MNSHTDNVFDVIVVGAGHAGCEAALAAARLGARTLLLGMNLDTVAQMSCNPAIGGIAKGQIVREIDALGGAMARAIDATSIQFRMLNASKGPAVWSPRAQADKRAYQDAMRHIVQQQPGLRLLQDTADEVIVERGRAAGVLGKTGQIYRAPAVVLTTGTFLKGLIHIGEAAFEGGRAGEPASHRLSDNLRALGFAVDRLKTGTPPRVNLRSVDVSKLQAQPSDKRIAPFAFRNRMERSDTFEPYGRVPCYLTSTGPETHEVIHANLHRAPLYTGQIQSRGPRYCPSIETKIERFPDREHHQVFLEPEGLTNNEVYCNGISTSLPIDVQQAMLETIPGLERAEVMRWGYAIEYDYVPPTQITHTLETRLVEGLFHAGQINGTSGYEEAAAQGMVAGANAALKLRGEAPLVLNRSEAYIGVMIDDLVTLGVDEPYRMFTSRAEFRLLLRQDNAEYRLMPIAHRLGLIDGGTWRLLDASRGRVAQGWEMLRRAGNSESTWEARLRQPGVTLDEVMAQVPGLDALGLNRYEKHYLQTEVKYGGYIARQEAQVARMAQMEDRPIPHGVDYDAIVHLRRETREKLSALRPATLGQAARIPGVTPADISVLGIVLAGTGKG